MENLTERFKKVRLHLGLSQPEMSERLGLSKNVWQTYELGKSAPGSVVLQGLIRMGFSANWILNGCGFMLIDECIHDFSGYTFLSSLESNASRGQRTSSERLDSIALKTDWLMARVACSVSELAWFIGSGDSMVPTITPGDLLLIDTSYGSLRGDGLYVFNFFDSNVVKRVQFLCDGTVEIISDNSLYRKQVISRDDLHTLITIGRVAWHGKFM